jgi:hypothetical protein
MAKLLRATAVLFLFSGGMAFMPAQADASNATPPGATSSALGDVRLACIPPRARPQRHRRPAIRLTRGPEKLRKRRTPASNMRHTSSRR